MNSGVNTEYISNAIDDLVNVLGVREEISTGKLLRFLKAKDVKGCIENMASNMGLPITVNLSYGSAFESRHVARTDSQGRGIESISAQVSFPRSLPFFGSTQMQGFPIDVKVSEGCTVYPETFITVIAHELSHVVLKSIWYRERDNEIHTDLAAAILGFSGVMKVGRITGGLLGSTMTIYGYLDHQGFDYAMNRIDKIRAEYRAYKKALMEKLSTCASQLSLCKRELEAFDRYLGYLDRNPSRRIWAEHVHKIIQFHQPDYTERLRKMMMLNDEKVKEATKFCTKLNHYTAEKLTSLKEFDAQISSSMSSFNEELQLFIDEVSLLRTYSVDLSIKWQEHATPYIRGFDMNPRKVWLGIFVPGKKTMAMIKQGVTPTQSWSLIDLFESEPYKSFVFAALALHFVAERGDKQNSAVLDIRNSQFGGIPLVELLTDIRNYLRLRFRVEGEDHVCSKSSLTIGQILRMDALTGAIDRDEAEVAVRFMVSHVATVLDTLSKPKVGGGTNGAELVAVFRRLRDMLLMMGEWTYSGDSNEYMLYFDILIDERTSA